MSDELIDFLVSQGHSEERAQQIAGNHPDAVRADLEAARAASEAKPGVATPDPSTLTPSATEEALRTSVIGKVVLAEITAFAASVFERIKELEGRHERLVDHVNLEISRLCSEFATLTEKAAAPAPTPAPTPVVEAPAQAPTLEVPHGEKTQEDAPTQEERAIPQA